MLLKKKREVIIRHTYDINRFTYPDIIFDVLKYISNWFIVLVYTRIAPINRMIVIVRVTGGMLFKRLSNMLIVLYT